MSLYFTDECGMSSARANRLKSSINSLLTFCEEDDDYDPVREAAVDKHIKAYERNIGPIDPENMNRLRTLFYSMYSEGYFRGRKSYYDENPQYVDPEDLEEY